MKVLSKEGVHQLVTETAGLDATALDLDTVEMISWSLRRAAGFLCPCSGSTLVNSLVQSYRGLVRDTGAFRIKVEDILENLVSIGDLFELSETGESERSETLLYLVPPTFVRRQSGTTIMLGLTPDNMSVLPAEIERQIEYFNYMRAIPASSSIGSEQLIELGYIELSNEAWLRAPTEESSSQHIGRLNQLLDAAQPSGEVPGLLVLDSDKSVRYYRGRWIESAQMSGRFVGRRTQAYGAGLWCYVELKNGIPRRLVDLPFKGSSLRGCDEAWVLQAAIDCERSQPQVFRLRQLSGGYQLLQLFSPIPMWATRRLAATGEPAEASGSLLSYRIRDAEVSEEVSFLRKHLWLAQET